MQFFEKVKDSVVQSSSKTKGGLAVLAVLTVVGVAAWIYQLFVGLGVTGMNNATSWGLYIALFMFFVGLSAGSMIVASAAHVFNIEWLKAITLPALICALVGICAGGISNPFRYWWLTTNLAHDRRGEFCEPSPLGYVWHNALYCGEHHILGVLGTGKTST